MVRGGCCNGAGRAADLRQGGSRVSLNKGSVHQGLPGWMACLVFALVPGTQGDSWRCVAPRVRPSELGWWSLACSSSAVLERESLQPLPSLLPAVFKYCSPTRSALQTGRNPIHVNVVNSPIQQVRRGVALSLSPCTTLLSLPSPPLCNNLPQQHNPKDTQSGFQGVPRNMTGLAAKLKGAGYSTHQVGKW